MTDVDAYAGPSSRAGVSGGGLVWSRLAAFMRAPEAHSACPFRRQRTITPRPDLDTSDRATRQGGAFLSETGLTARAGRVGSWTGSG